MVLTRPKGRVLHLRATFVVWLACLCAVAQGKISILTVSPTPLFPNAQPLRQIAVLEILNDGAQTIRCRIRASSGAQATPFEVQEIAPGASAHRILVPDLEKAAAMKIEMRNEQDGVLATRTQDWQPQRKWKVFIVHASHEDLGYEDFIFKKQRQNAEWVDIGRRLSKPKATPGTGAYHYTIESLLLARNYIDERSEPEWRTLVESQIKTGGMDLMGAPSGVHADWMDYEEVARMSYPARREFRDRYGLDLKTFMMVDNPSLSWSGAQALAEAGFRYVARWGQGWRTGGINDYQHTHLPALFWWQAPDGVHRVLFAWRSHYGLSFWYGQPSGGYGNFLELGSDQVSKELKHLEDGSLLGPYPYDAVIYPCYVDHAIPHIDERSLPAWNESYAYPQIQIASPTAFFQYVENKYGSQLPVLSGELNNFSGDYASIDPQSQGWKRQASRTLPFAEGLSAIALYLTRSFQPVTARVASLWMQIFDYDEHSWPTLPRATDVHIFNANWVKKQGAERAYAGANELLEQALKSLALNVPVSGANNSIVVVNPLAHAQDGIVTVRGNFAGLEDLATGRVLPCENSDGNTIFVALRVPAYGYKVYREVRSVTNASRGLRASNDEIENQFYQVRFDRRTGYITSIVDKQTGRELVDGKSRYPFNGLVYVHKDQRESKQGFEYVPAAANRTEAHAGPVQAEFNAWIEDAKTGAAIRQTVRLFDGVRRIDFVDEIRHARVMYSEDHEDRYRDNIFYAFPLNVPGGQPRVEYAGGVVRPYYDQLPWGSYDYLVANRWVDVSTPDFGITITPWNEATFDFGEIRYNQFSNTYKPANSHLFSYAWSNRMAGLLTLGPEESNATVGYSLRAHQGDWNSGAVSEFGWSIASPMTAYVIPVHDGGVLDSKEMSFISVDAPNVQLTVLKASEQPGHGWIARFVETEGKATNFNVESRLLPPGKAFVCDLVEDDLGEAPVSGNRVRLSIAPFGHTTLRFESGTAPRDKVTVSGSAVSGKRVHLAWNGARDAQYNVYRSTDPQDPPTAFTLIARTSEPNLDDVGLDPASTYYYHVAPVSANNLQGELSAETGVTTLDKDGEPPAPVSGLGVVRLGKNRLMLVWNKNQEPDVARYRIYRNEGAELSINGSNLLATIPPTGYFLETYIDTKVEPGHTYFYKVAAEDWAGHCQRDSPLLSSASPN